MTATAQKILRSSRGPLTPHYLLALERQTAFRMSLFSCDPHALTNARHYARQARLQLQRISIVTQDTSARELAAVIRLARKHAMERRKLIEAAVSKYEPLQNN